MTEPGFSKCECRHCAGHIEFPVAAAGQTVPCPHCGQPTRLGDKKQKRSLVPLVFTIVLFLSIIGTTIWFLLPHKGGPQPDNASTTATTKTPAPKTITDEIITNQFSVSGVKLAKTTNSSLIYVTGTVRNLAAEKRFGVKVEFVLQTVDATSAGTASDYASSLDPSSDWNFKALVLDSKAASARFSSIAETK